MTTATATIPRTLSAIVLDMNTTRSRLASVIADVGPLGAPSAVQDELWTELERRFEALDLEFRAVFREANGIEWDRVRGAMG